MSLPASKDLWLPNTYVAAKAALAECVRIDELKGVEDVAKLRAAAAQMANDTEMENQAKRIRARAVRRMGELVNEIPAESPGPSKIGQGAPTQLSKTEAAREAGLSKHQQNQAVNVANVPEEQFDEMVDGGESPASVTAIAKEGRKPKPKPVVIDTDGRSNEEYRRAMYMTGIIKHYSQQIKGFVDDGLPELNVSEINAVQEALESIKSSHAAVIAKIYS